jgi:cytochrome c peroxidase
MILTLLLACASEPKGAPTPEPKAAAPASSRPAGLTVDPAKKALFAPLPADMATPERPVTPERVALGRLLYFENRLSKNQALSCNSCHDVARFGVDNQPTSPGHKGQLGGRNSPTSFNAAGHIAQFWDGRAADVEAQAKGPVLNPVEMAMPDEASVVTVLKSIPGYAEPFAKAFPGDQDPITYDNMAIAIGAFERTFVTPSPFDAYLAGNDAALTDAQKKGLNTFVDVGCATCHAGAYLGGSMYQKLGLVESWPNQKDLGRFDATKSEADKLFFKVPSLRNIENTGPYFHDGSVASLDEAIRMMARHQLGKQLTPEQTSEVKAFLGALTGTIDPGAVARPELPPSGPNTPKADPG